MSNYGGRDDSDFDWGIFVHSNNNQQQQRQATAASNNNNKRKSTYNNFPTTYSSAAAASSAGGREPIVGRLDFSDVDGEEVTEPIRAAFPSSSSHSKHLGGGGPAGGQSSASAKVSRRRESESDDKLSAERLRYRADKSNLEGEIRRLKTERTEEEAKRKRQEIEFNAAKAKLEQRISSLEMELSFVKGNETKLTERMRERETEFESERVGLVRLQERMKRERRESYGESSFNNDSKNSEEKQQLRGEIFDLKTEIAGFREREGTLLGQNEQFEKRITRMNADIKALTLAKLDGDDHIRALKEELANYEDNRLLHGGMREDIENASAVKNENEKLKRLVTQYKSSSLHTSVLQEKNKIYETQLEGYKRKLSQLSIENNELKCFIAEQTNDRSTASDGDGLARDAASKMIPFEMTPVEAMAEKLVTYSQTAEKAKTEAKTKSMLLDQFRKTVKDVTHNREQMRQELMGQLEELANEQDKHMDQIHRLEEEVSKKSAEIDRLHELNEQLVSKNEELRSQMEYGEKLLDQNEGEVQMLKDMMNQEQERFTALKAEHQSEVEELRRQKEDAVARAVEMESNAAAARAEAEAITDSNQKKADVESQAAAVDDESQYKVQHMKHNLLDEEHAQFLRDNEEMSQENNRLRVLVDEYRRNREEKAMTADGGSSAGATETASGADDKNIEQMANHRLEIEQLNEKIQEIVKEKDAIIRRKDRSLNIQKTFAHEYRETCTILTGLQRDGERVNLLSSPYAEEWTDLIEMYLAEEDCIPAFLAAVTLQCHQKEKDRLEDMSTDDRTDDTANASVDHHEGNYPSVATSSAASYGSNHQL